MRAALVKGPLEAAFTRPRLRRPAVLRLVGRPRRSRLVSPFQRASFSTTEIYKSRYCSRTSAQFRYCSLGTAAMTPSRRCPIVTC